MTTNAVTQPGSSGPASPAISGSGSGALAKLGSSTLGFAAVAVTIWIAGQSKNQDLRQFMNMLLLVLAVSVTFSRWSQIKSLFPSLGG